MTRNVPKPTVEASGHKDEEKQSPEDSAMKNGIFQESKQSTLCHNRISTDRGLLSL